MGFNVAAVLAENATTGQRIALSVGGTIGGTLLLAVVVLLFLLIRAPVAQRNEARKAVTDAIDEAVEARVEGEREKADAVARVEAERDEALRQVAELEAPKDDPDPRVALANRAEHRAARLRALCQHWDGRISRGVLMAYMDEQGAAALSDALAEYESEHSTETRRIVGELVEAKVMDAHCKVLVERPQSLGDLRNAADRLQDAAERIKVKPPDSDKAGAVALLREAYKTGRAIREGNIWGEGAPTDHKGLARATSKAWDRAATWGVDTYGMLREHFPGPWERAFFGAASDGNHAFGTTGFRLQVSAEREDGRIMAPDDWMDAKLKILSDMLGEYDR